MAKELFRDEPLVLVVPGSGGDFIRYGREWTATGDVFRAALRQLSPANKDIEIGRRALVTFSAGWQFGHGILGSQKERDRLDAYLVEDGIHTSELTRWTSYATRAAKGEALMAMAHTNIVPPFVSTTTTNTKVFKDAMAAAGAVLELDLTEHLANPEFPAEGIRVRAGSPPATKKWDKDPLKEWERAGQLYRLDYGGTTGSDHMFISWIVGPRLWRVLADRWNTVTIPKATITAGEPEA
jgi:hypothetical protein